MGGDVLDSIQRLPVRPARTEKAQAPEESKAEASRAEASRAEASRAEASKAEASKAEASKEDADLGQAFHPPSADKTEDAAPKNGKKPKTKTAEPEDSL